MPSNSRLQSIYTLLKLRYHSNYDISVLQLLFCKDFKFERMRGCNCSFMIVKELFIEWVSLNCKLTHTFQRPVKYIAYAQIMAASVLLKNTISTEEWMAASWNKETLYPEKNCFLQLNAVTWKENFFFRNRYFGSHSFFMGCYLTKIFVHLPVIPLVCYFSVYKLIAWDPANIYLFKVNSGNTTKRVWNKAKVYNKYNRKLLWCLYC